VPVASRGSGGGTVTVSRPRGGGAATGGGRGCRRDVRRSEGRVRRRDRRRGGGSARATIERAVRIIESVKRTQK